MLDKIAIIGSDSFLASYLVKKLSASYELRGYSRKNNIKIPNHITFDYPITKLEFKELLDFDSIIYCAGNGVQGGTTDELVFSVNCFLPIEIASFLQRNNYTGTLFTFGTYFEIGNNTRKKYFTEEEVLSSLLDVPNSYCISKRLLSKFFFSSNLTFNYYHLLLPTVYGMGENNNRLIPYIINKLIAQEEPILTSGEQTRQYIHASDVANLISYIIETHNIKSGIYNVPSFETLTVKEIVYTIYKTLNVLKKPIWNTSNRYDVSMKFLALDATRLALSIPNWRPTNAIANSIDSYKLNDLKYGTNAK